jgi:predicted phosphodiesterase
MENKSRSTPNKRDDFIFSITSKKRTLPRQQSTAIQQEQLKIQILSDTHIEFWDNPAQCDFIKPIAPILALLGDICCCGTDADFNKYMIFINHLLPKFENIIIVAGNHEFWHSEGETKRGSTIGAAELVTMRQIDKKLRQFCATSKKLHYLNNNTMRLMVGNQPYIFIGSTLWTNIKKENYEKVTKMMNDYKFINVEYADDTAQESGIRKLQPEDTTKMHLRSVAYITGQLAKIQKVMPTAKIIVLTHHKPYISPYSKFSETYESDLCRLFGKGIALWAYGHTHVRDDITFNYDKGKIRIYSNPKGYPYQRTGYKKDDVLII